MNRSEIYGGTQSPQYLPRKLEFELNRKKKIDIHNNLDLKM